jgi:hypothetical protein
MMFLFGGIPEIYYERFKDRAARELSSDDFTGLPLYPSQSRTYVLDRTYCRELINTLVAYVEGRPQCLIHGLGVVLILREWEHNNFDTNFLPFGLCKVCHVGEPISRSGVGASRTANKYTEIALEAASRLRSPVRAMTAEFETRLRRTPLLLPLRHFDSEHLCRLITEILEAIGNSAVTDDAIKAACRRFEMHHPFQRQGKGGSFESPKGIRFTAPPRNWFHGQRAENITGDHNEACFLNARMRLGGAFADGFHYDCTRGNSHSGYFKNCHGAERHYQGSPHLNVYPNDFIR